MLTAVFENKDISAKDQGSELKQLSKNISITIAHKIYLDMEFKRLNG